MTSLYDALGHDYARWRRPDPRIAEAVRQALGDASSVLNVGAGAGSYEPRDRSVIGAEPSPVMLAQRPAGAAPALRAIAEALPLATGSVDASLAVLTHHHWTDWRAGMRELAQVRHRLREGNRALAVARPRPRHHQLLLRDPHVDRRSRARPWPAPAVASGAEDAALESIRSRRSRRRRSPSRTTCARSRSASCGGRASAHRKAASENLAWAATVRQAQELLIDSPGHRANILNPDFGRIGIGAAIHPEHGWMFTQAFAD